MSVKKEILGPPLGHLIEVRTPANLVEISSGNIVPCVEIKRYFPTGKWVTIFEVDDHEKNEQKIGGQKIGSARIQRG